jgi:hypothetical protein
MSITSISGTRSILAQSGRDQRHLYETSGEEARSAMAGANTPVLENDESDAPARATGAAFCISQLELGEPRRRKRIPGTRRARRRLRAYDFRNANKRRSTYPYYELGFRDDFGCQVAAGFDRRD